MAVYATIWRRTAFAGGTTKAYVHAVIDKFSRRILSWRVAGSSNPASTVAVLLEACRAATGNEPPTVLADGGVENFSSVRARTR